MKWDDLRLLLAVARRGNFLQAGEALGMAPSILSRRITMAEAALVERGADGTRLTARGMAGGDTEDGGLAGTVRVSAGEGFVAPVQAAIAEFTDRHPACSVDFTVAADLVRLARSAADVALRIVHLARPR